MIRLVQAGEESKLTGTSIYIGKTTAERKGNPLADNFLACWSKKGSLGDAYVHWLGQIWQDPDIDPEAHRALKDIEDLWPEDINLVSEFPPSVSHGRFIKQHVEAINNDD